MTLRPLGPRVTLTALARASTPRLRLSRASISNLISFAMIDISYYFLLGDEGLLVRFPPLGLPVREGQPDPGLVAPGLGCVAIILLSERIRS